MLMGIDKQQKLQPLSPTPLRCLRTVSTVDFSCYLAFTIVQQNVAHHFFHSASCCSTSLFLALTTKYKTSLFNVPESISITFLLFTFNLYS
jgi:hypothetical protein